jgi:hypothetical protein
VVASLADLAELDSAPCRLNGDYDCNHFLDLEEVLLHLYIHADLPTATIEPSDNPAC